jgi:hypothetical protein
MRDWFVNITVYYVLRIFRDRKIYLGHDSIFQKLNPRYHIFKFPILQSNALANFQSEIPELTKWCKENKCIYGWTTEIHRSEYLEINTYLFIATVYDNSYTLIKLRWA